MAIDQATYRDAEKAQALALMRAGSSAVEAAAEIGIPERTVSRWAKRWREVTTEEEAPELLADDYRITRRSTELIHEAYDVLEEGPRENLVKQLIPLNAIRGTAVDKILKRQQLAQQAEQPSIQRGPFVIFMGQSVQHQDVVTTIDAQATVSVLPPAPAPDTKPGPDPEP